MKTHLLWFLVMVAASVGCGEMEANDSSGAPAETVATPLTAEAAPRNSSAASRDVDPPAEVEAPEPSVAAMASHTCGACILDQGVNEHGNYKGARSCCWNVPVIDENGKVSHICIPYQQDCSPSWPSASRL